MFDKARLELFRKSHAARLRARGYGEADIEDIIQESLAETMRQKESVVDEWAYASVIVSRTASAFRRKRRHATLDNLEIEAPPSSVSPLGEAAQLAAIKKIVLQLDPEERQLIYEVFYRPGSIREAARRVGMKSSTFHNRLTTVLAKITRHPSHLPEMSVVAIVATMFAAKLYQLEQSKRDSEFTKMYSEKGQIAFGNAIRSYFLYPEQRVKDSRLGHMTSNTQGVLDGDIQDFIDAELRRRAGTRQK